MLLLYIIHHCVGLFLTSLCAVFASGLAFPASPPSPPPSFLLSLSFGQVLSHNAHNSSHKLLSSHNSHSSSPTTQLNSHNSSHTAHLTQLISHNTTHSRAAFAWLLVELLSCRLTELHPSSLTQLISQLTQLIPHNSFISLLTQLNSLKSCFRVAFGGTAFV